MKKGNSQAGVKDGLSEVSPISKEPVELTRKGPAQVPARPSDTVSTDRGKFKFR